MGGAGQNRGRRLGPGEERLVGAHAVREALRSGRRPLRRLLILEGLERAEARELGALAGAAGVPVERVSRQELAAGAGDGRSPGVVLEAGPIPVVGLEELLGGEPGTRCLVALDGVEDPQNLGAVIRVAETAGAQGLVLTERRAPPLSPAVARASAGALEHLPVARVTNLPRALKQLKAQGFWVMGSVLGEAEDLFRAPAARFRGDLVLAFGAEDKGLRRGILELLDHRVRIPMAGRIGSLNVATAAAVVLYEVARRRRTIGGDPPVKPGDSAC